MSKLSTHHNSHNSPSLLKSSLFGKKSRVEKNSAFRQSAIVVEVGAGELADRVAVDITVLDVSCACTR